VKAAIDQKWRECAEAPLMISSCLVSTTSDLFYACRRCRLPSSSPPPSLVVASNWHNGRSRSRGQSPLLMVDHLMPAYFQSTLFVDQ